MKIKVFMFCFFLSGYDEKIIYLRFFLILEGFIVFFVILFYMIGSLYR